MSRRLSDVSTDQAANPNHRDDYYWDGNDSFATPASQAPASRGPLTLGDFGVEYLRPTLELGSTSSIPKARTSDPEFRDESFPADYDEKQDEPPTPPRPLSNYERIPAPINAKGIRLRYPDDIRARKENSFYVINKNCDILIGDDINKVRTVILFLNVVLRTRFTDLEIVINENALANYLGKLLDVENYESRKQLARCFLLVATHRHTTWWWDKVTSLTTGAKSLCQSSPSLHEDRDWSSSMIKYRLKRIKSFLDDTQKAGESEDDERLINDIKQLKEELCPDIKLLNGHYFGMNLTVNDKQKALVPKAQLCFWEEADLSDEDLRGMSVVVYLRKTRLHRAKFDDATRIILRFPLLETPEDIDQYFNHINNRCSGSILTDIEAIPIPDELEAIKLNLMEQVIVHIDQESINIEPCIEAFRDVLLDEHSTYLRSSCVKRFILEQRLISEIREANEVKLELDSIRLPLIPSGMFFVLTELCSMLSEMRSEDAFLYIRDNNGFINQLIYQARNSRDETIEKLGNELFYLCLEMLPKPMITAYRELYLPLNEDTPHPHFIANNGQFFMVFSDIYYAQHLLGEIPQSASEYEGWTSAWHFEPGGEGFICKHPDSLDTRMETYPLLNRIYQQDNNQSRFRLLIRFLRLGDPYEFHFLEALGGSRYATKFVTIQHQDRLNAIFEEKFIYPEGPENTLIDGEIPITFNMQISDVHYRELLETFEYTQKPHHQQAILLVCLSAIFTRYSSDLCFGRDLNSPLAPRKYGLALLNKAVELDPEIFQAVLADWRNRFTGSGIISCSAILSKMMKDSINELGGIWRETLRSLLPPAWQ